MDEVPVVYKEVGGEELANGRKGWATAMEDGGRGWPYRRQGTAARSAARASRASIISRTPGPRGAPACARSQSAA